MHDFIFQPFGNFFLNGLFSFTVVSLILSSFFYIKQIKNAYVILILLSIGISISVYSHLQQNTDGFSIGLLIGLVISAYAAFSLGAANEESHKKTSLQNRTKTLD